MLLRLTTGVMHRSTIIFRNLHYFSRVRIRPLMKSVNTTTTAQHDFVYLSYHYRGLPQLTFCHLFPSYIYARFSAGDRGKKLFPSPPPIRTIAIFTTVPTKTTN